MKERTADGRQLTYPRFKLQARSSHAVSLPLDGIGGERLDKSDANPLFLPCGSGPQLGDGKACCPTARPLPSLLPNPAKCCCSTFSPCAFAPRR